MKAADLPVGTRVTTKSGAIYVRDRLGWQGWWRYPQGHYFDQELDGLIRDGATVRLPEENR